MDQDLSAFGRTYRRFMEVMTHAADEGPSSPVRDLIDGHLGEDGSVLPVVSEGYAQYDHVNLQVALPAYLEMSGRDHELVGLSGQQRRWMSLSDLVATSHHAGVGIGSVDLVNLPVGPEETLACVAFGLYLIEERGTKLVALLRATDEQSGQEEVRLEVLCRDRDAALAMLAELHLALHLPLPNDHDRLRLLELYGRGLDLRLDDRDEVVRRTAGVTASFMKELMRKAALLSALEGEGNGAPTVTDRHVTAALDELLADGGEMTRALLGAVREGTQQPHAGTEWLLSSDDQV